MPPPPASPAPAPRVLVVEDEAKVALALKRTFTAEGFDAKICADGSAAAELLASEPFDAVVLDWMLPGRDGLVLLRGLRGRGDTTPVIMLTARDAVDARVTGLNAGADDYLVKPFALDELLAPVRALLRRGQSIANTGRLSCGDLVCDSAARRVTRRGEAIELTPRELSLLEALLRQHGRAVSRDTLAREVWREPRRLTSLDNVIDVHMTHLRQKIDGAHAVRLIHSVRGVGFAIREPAATTAPA